MRKRASKQFDTVLEKLLSELVKADKVLDNPPLLSLTMKTIRRLAEMQDYKGMYKSYIFPKANKYIADVKKVLSNSRYKALIKDEFADVDEYRNDTVRLAIVGLYHKYEGFRKALIRDYMEYHRELDISVDVEQYVRENFGFKLSENWKNSTLYKLSWLSNRIKHDSSLPVNFEHPDRETPETYELLDSTKKMVIAPQEFYDFCDEVYQYCHDLFQLFNQVSLKIQLMEDGIDPEMERILDLDIREKTTRLNNRLDD
jgi:hypothetical protein